MSKVDDKCLYTSTHEWALRVSDNVVAIGVTDYAQHALGDIVYVSEANVGGSVKSGDQVGIIDSVKVSAELYSPVSGKIIEFNAKLSDSPELINNDPYIDGWIVKVEISEPSELSSLMTAAQYKELVGSE